MAKKEQKTHWLFLIIFLAFLAFLAFMITGIVSLFVGLAPDEQIATGNVAMISIKGPIYVDEYTSVLSEESASSTQIVRFIEKADENPAVKAILFEINSPGGSAVASEEIANAVKKTNKTTVAWIREVGASGGYWIASATDYIVADRMSITGSIGVISSYLDFSGFISRYNVSYQRLIAGKYKDAGSPFRKLTDEEELILQKKLDKIHDFFIKEIADNRNLAEGNVRDIATGMFYLGIEAKDLGLIDELGGKEEAIAYIEEKEGITADIAEYKKTKGFFDMLGIIADQRFYYLGQGIGNAFVKHSNEDFLKIKT